MIEIGPSFWDMVLLISWLALVGFMVLWIPLAMYYGDKHGKEISRRKAADRAPVIAERDRRREEGVRMAARAALYTASAVRLKREGRRGHEQHEKPPGRVRGVEG